MRSAFEALCCGARCGRGTPDTGPCEADSYGRRIAERAEAAGYVVEQGWQPIETAPRDGTWILGLPRVIFFDGTPNCEIVRWCAEDSEWDTWGGDPTRITAWRPLPAPPTEPTR